jgi:hypothetical protein
LKATLFAFFEEKSMKKLLIFCAILTIALAVSSLAQAATVYQTGFEPTTYAIGNLGGQDAWQKWYSGADRFTVQNTTVKSGSQAVKAYTNGDNTDARYLDSVLSVGATDILTLSYDQYLTTAWFSGFSQGSTAFTVTVRPVGGGPYDPYYQMVLSTWKQPTMQRIGFGVDGSQLAVAFDQSVLENKWSNLRLVANNGTGSAEAFLNGGSLGTVAFTPGGITNFESIDIRATSGFGYRDAYIDNLSLSIVPEPATMCLLGLGALGLLRKRRA